MAAMNPVRAWAVITNHKYLRLDNIKSTRNAASEHMSYLDRVYPHCVGTRRVARIEIREVVEEGPELRGGKHE